MPQTISISPHAAGRALGFELWTQRVLDRAEKVRETWDADGVHDLRVALRRCRTMAEALAQVNPDAGWRKLRKSSREVFRVLGGLRDTQVERQWIKKLSAPRDPLRSHLLRLLAAREKQRCGEARRALEDFRAKEWKKLARKLGRKAQLFPAESVVFQRLASRKLEEAAELFARARKSRSSAAWHRARIGLKHFRYIGENFLPQRFAPWAGEVKHLQDLLGDVHDLDVLWQDARRNAGKIDPAVTVQWRERIQTERKTRLAEVTARLSGERSLLAVWRAGFPSLRPLAAAPLLDRRSA